MSEGKTRPRVPGEVDVPPDALVVRFRPFSNPEDVLRAADKEHRRRSSVEHPDQTFYRISTFVGVKTEGEDDEDLLRRLIKVAGLTSLDLGKHKNCWLARSGDLQELNVPFCKDGDDDEPEDHYSLDLGSAPTVESVERLMAVFRGPERTQR